jgi:hypothetical protein
MPIGTKVTHRNDFLIALIAKIDQTDFGTSGQVYIDLPEALLCVSGGLARREGVRHVNVRAHRGQFGVYAPRVLAEPPEKLGVVVYTIKAYAADPEVDEEEVRNMTWGQIKYVIVAVLSTPAGVGGDGVMSTYRFTSNLAGGNNKYKPENGYTLDKAISDAKLCLEYENTWMTVAD